MARFRSLFAIALVGSLVVALAPTTGAQPREDKSDRTCDPLDGKYENGAWENGIAASGITVTSFSDESVTFDVAEGWTLFGLCVKSGRELDVYNSNVQLPAHGPASVALTKAGPGYGIGHVSFDTDVTPPVTCPTVEAPPVTFAAPEFIDRSRAGGEPVSVVAQDGSISVSAHAGTTHIYKDPEALPGAGDFAVGYTNQTLTWRLPYGKEGEEEDWEYVGLAGLPAGPHSATSTGFSDPDYAMDQAGNIYNTEIDLANVAVFKSDDDGQSYNQANPYAWFGDRPWLTALEPNEVFLYTNLPKFLLKSVDGGVTWIPTTGGVAIGGKAIPDPLHPNNGLIGPVGGQDSVGTFAIGLENDAGLDSPKAPAVSWQTKTFGPMGRTEQFFGVVAADRAGNVYQAGAGGYSGAGDVTPNGEVTFGYYERATDTKNPSKIVIPTPSGDALWPWVIAGDDGRVAVVWYQNLAFDPANPNNTGPQVFYIFAAVTHNAHGTTVTCSDGSKKFIPPQFTVLNASQRPMAFGHICLAGTNCNRDTDFQRGDRRLGDFFTVNFDHFGNLFIVSADTTLTNPLGGPKPVGNPIFIRQDSGPAMLEGPIDEPRPTRCLMNLPVC